MNLSMKEKIVARRVLRELRLIARDKNATDTVNLLEQMAKEWGLTLDAPSVEKPVRGRSTGAQILNNRTRPPRRN